MEAFLSAHPDAAAETEAMRATAADVESALAAEPVPVLDPARRQDLLRRTRPAPMLSLRPLGTVAAAALLAVGLLLAGHPGDPGGSGTEMAGMSRDPSLTDLSDPGMNGRLTLKFADTPRSKAKNGPGAIASYNTAIGWRQGGRFFNDNSDGDHRARTENIFTSTLGRALGVGGGAGTPGGDDGGATYGFAGGGGGGGHQYDGDKNLDDVTNGLDDGASAGVQVTRGEPTEEEIKRLIANGLEGPASTVRLKDLAAAMATNERLVVDSAKARQTREALLNALDHGRFTVQVPTVRYVATNKDSGNVVKLGNKVHISYGGGGSLRGANLSVNDLRHAIASMHGNGKFAYQKIDIPTG
ncbi:MAG: hypothetical protein ACYTG4_09540, partial [Planctomycetota bacterium]